MGRKRDLEIEKSSKKVGALQCMSEWETERAGEWEREREWEPQREKMRFGR